MYSGQYEGANTASVYSGSIWGDCPVESLRNKSPNGPAGFLWEMNFDSGALLVEGAEAASGLGLQVFASTGAAAVSVADTTEVGGGQRFGSDGDNEGAGIRTYATPCKINLNNGDLWFEARVLTSTISDTKHGFFLGLIEAIALSATIPLTAAGALADYNLVGFHRLEGDGDYVDAVYKADTVTAVTQQADAGPLVAATYTNLGLKFVSKRNMKKGAGYLYWYQDGAVVASKLIPSTSGDDFPNDVFLGFCFAVLNATGSTPGYSSIKHARLAQLI